MPAPNSFMHFETGKFVPHHKFLSDETYGLALDSLVKGCSDILVVAVEAEETYFFLGKRKVEPQVNYVFCYAITSVPLFRLFFRFSFAVSVICLLLLWLSLLL